MKESKPGFIERGADKVKRAAKILGAAALLGSIFVPAWAGFALESGLVWFGADQAKILGRKR